MESLAAPEPRHRDRRELLDTWQLVRLAFGGKFRTLPVTLPVTGAQSQATFFEGRPCGPHRRAPARVRPRLARLRIGLSCPQNSNSSGCGLECSN